jgi:hypothetical protein
MFIRKIAIGVILSAAAFLPTISQAAGPPPQTVRSAAAQAPCVLKKYQVSSVTPYKVQESIGGHIFHQRVAGAELYIQAEPGLTAEWLQLNLNREVTAMQGGSAMKDCVFGVDQVQVQVESAGPGFRVRLSAPGTDAGHEVLRRAQLLAS